MSKSFSLNTLTEGIRDRNVGQEGRRLIEKWTRTGLLRGLDDHKRETMSRLLENQAAQVLREVSSVSTGAGGLTSSGDLQGFSNIAFPIVRRVFGGLVANELVSIQPMSLPSGLLFYLDYTYGSDVGGDNDLNADNLVAGASTYKAGDSIYGSPAGKGVRSGSIAIGGQYDLAGATYSKVHDQVTGLGDSIVVASGAFAGGSTLSTSKGAHATGSDGKLLQYDVQLSRQIELGTHEYSFLIVNLTETPANAPFFPNLDTTNIKSFALTAMSDISFLLTLLFIIDFFKLLTFSSILLSPFKSFSLSSPLISLKALLTESNSALLSLSFKFSIADSPPIILTSDFNAFSSSTTSSSLCVDSDACCSLILSSLSSTPSISCSSINSLILGVTASNIAFFALSSATSFNFLASAIASSKILLDIYIHLLVYKQ